ncbi:MAG: MipA/OmpV family protein, partial [Pseudomonadota bacterium]
MRKFGRVSLTLGGAALFLGISPALAGDTDRGAGASTLPEEESANSFEIAAVQQPPQGAERPGPPAGGPPGMSPGEKPVFDETWATIGIGAGLVPSYSGSDDYVLFPLPLIVGRVGGVGISPSAAGLTLDLLSQPPEPGPPTTSVALGPTFRFRNDRADRIRDEVVELAGELDTAIEVGASGSVSFPAMINDFDRLSISTTVRWDILGAHDGMVVEPTISYFTPMGRGSALQLSAGLEFVDDSFADYYYSITPAQSAATGLAQFTADGGLN